MIKLYKKRWKMLFLIVFSLFIFSIIFFGSNNSVYGKTNTIYNVEDNSGEVDITNDSSESPLLDAIGKFIYAIASFIEYIISYIMKKIIGENFFPWADRILFNTIPFLDVNFINPAEGSLFINIYGETTVVGGIIQKIYYFIYILSITFLGISVGIMAIKLALSSIASEKAKYKDAIKNWLFALILVFTTHYLISFIFFINEKIIEIAGEILEENISDKYVEISTVQLDFSNMEEVVHNAFFEVFEAGWGTEEVHINNVTVDFGDDRKITGEFHLTSSGVDKFKYTVSITSMDYGDMTSDISYKFDQYLALLLVNEDYLSNYCLIYDWSTKSDQVKDLFNQKTISGTASGIVKGIGLVASLVVDSNTDTGEMQMEYAIKDALILTIMDQYFTQVVYPNVNPDKEPIEINSIEEAKIIFLDAWAKNRGDVKDEVKDKIHLAKDAISGIIHLNPVKAIGNVYSLGVIDTASPEESEDYINAIIDVYSDMNTLDAKDDLFTNLAKFFKKSIYGVETNSKGELVGFTSTKFNAIPAFIYAIFIIQSLMYLVAYIKRLFYVIILALFAPLVIIYDFVMKIAV